MLRDARVGLCKSTKNIQTAAVSRMQNSDARGAYFDDDIDKGVHLLNHTVRGGGELIDLKSYTQMTDFRDFRYPYRFEKLYFDDV